MWSRYHLQDKTIRQFTELSTICIELSLGLRLHYIYDRFSNMSAETIITSNVVLHALNPLTSGIIRFHSTCTHTSGACVSEGAGTGKPRDSLARLPM